MKRILLLFFVCLPAIQVFSQTGEFTPGGKDRLIMEINHNHWSDLPDSLNQNWYSRGFNTYVMYDLALGSALFSIAPGFGIGTENVFHNGEIRTDTSGTWFHPIHDSIKYTRNKLAFTYFDVPLELRFRSRPNSKNHSFKLGLGIKAGLMLASHTKYVGAGNIFGIHESDIKIKRHRVPNLERIRYGVTGRIGYGPFNLVVYYGLGRLFEENLGLPIKAWSVGISFNGL